MQNKENAFDELPIPLEDLDQVFDSLISTSSCIWRSFWAFSATTTNMTTTSLVAVIGKWGCTLRGGELFVINDKCLNIGKNYVERQIEVQAITPKLKLLRKVLYFLKFHIAIYL